MDQKSFTESWIKKLKSQGIPIFPDDYLTGVDFTTINIPKKTLMIGKEFFGKFEVITTEGESVLQADSYDEARYMVYSSRDRSGNIKLPKDKSKILTVLKNYEYYLDKLITEITLDAKKSFPEKKDFTPVNTILQSLNLIRY